LRSVSLRLPISLSTGKIKPYAFWGASLRKHTLRDICRPDPFSERAAFHITTTARKAA
jgi:hypothetical protein